MDGLGEPSRLPTLLANSSAEATVSAPSNERGPVGLAGRYAQTHVARERGRVVRTGTEELTLVEGDCKVCSMTPAIGSCEFVRRT